MVHLRALSELVRYFLIRLSFLAIVLLALGSTYYTVSCLFGYSEWLFLPLTFGETTIPAAGLYVQSGLTLLSLALCFFLPSNARIMALENSHRSFQMGMQDVARAYAAAHRADRTGVFKIQNEFDSIRERIQFLRNHPDLIDLETPVLELAAQMSHISRELAHVYSDKNVARARDFLTARQEEVSRMQERIKSGKDAIEEMRDWISDVDREEAELGTALRDLKANLQEILPEIYSDEALAKFAKEDREEEKMAAQERSATIDPEEAPAKKTAGRKSTASAAKSADKRSEKGPIVWEKGKLTVLDDKRATK